MTPDEANAYALKVVTAANTLTQAHTAALAAFGENPALISGTTPVRLIQTPTPAPAPIAPVTPAPAPVPKSTVAANLATTVFMTVAAFVFLVLSAGKITLPKIVWPTTTVVTPDVPVTPTPKPVTPVTPVAPTPSKPAPGAYTGQLQGITILPVNETQTEATMKASNVDIQAAFKAANGLYNCVNADHSSVSSEFWKETIAKNGPPPVLIFIDPSQSTGGKVVVVGSSRVSSPADVVAAVKKLRGTP